MIGSFIVAVVIFIIFYLLCWATVEKEIREMIKNNWIFILALVAIITLAGCSSWMPQRYHELKQQTIQQHDWRYHNGSRTAN